MTVFICIAFCKESMHVVLYCWELYYITLINGAVMIKNV